MVRKHNGIIQSGPNKGRLKPGYRFTGDKTQSGKPIIVKSKSLKGGALWKKQHRNRSKKEIREEKEKEREMISAAYIAQERKLLGDRMTCESKCSKEIRKCTRKCSMGHCSKPCKNNCKYCKECYDKKIKEHRKNGRIQPNKTAIL